MVEIVKKYGVTVKDGNGQINTMFICGISDRWVNARVNRKHGEDNVISIARSGKIVAHNLDNRSTSTE